MMRQGVTSIGVTLSDARECIQLIRGYTAFYFHGSYEEMAAFGQSIINEAAKRKAARLTEFIDKVRAFLVPLGWKAEKNYGGEWEITSPDHDLQVTFEEYESAPIDWRLARFTDSDRDGVAVGRYVRSGSTLDELKAALEGEPAEVEFSA